MKTTLIIKNNHGNHSGFNVKWTLIDTCVNRKEAIEKIIDKSVELYDGHPDYTYRNGRIYHRYSKQCVSSNQHPEFEYDGQYYKIIDIDDRDYFDGGSWGYLPSFFDEELLEN